MSILAEKVRMFGMSGLMRNCQQTLLSALLPQDCQLCASPSGDDLLCPACAAELPRLPKTACPRCALASPAGETCGRCQRHPPHFDRLIACYPYSFPVDRLIQRLKYGHQLALTAWFGQQLAAACATLTFDRIVPMPLHLGRLAERGFNQATEISRTLARERAMTIDNGCCERVRATTPQEGLTLRERRRNLRNAFACNSDLNGEHVLLVDDVVTTGASVNECARTLRLHGASEITVLTVARTLLA
ncbi:MAG: ComF family protein [Betaproteobacteria bacterium]|nr:ComF family protein [Betaproteobacteria bacterium]